MLLKSEIISLKSIHFIWFLLKLGDSLLKVGQVELKVSLSELQQGHFNLLLSHGPGQQGSEAIV